MIAIRPHHSGYRRFVTFQYDQHTALYRRSGTFREHTIRDLVVAIYGGGPSSATLANAIKYYEHIDLQYFDSAQNLTPTSYRLYGFASSVYNALLRLVKQLAELSTGQNGMRKIRVR
jgi:hypothetical protein